MIDLYPYKFKNRDAFFDRNHGSVSLLDRDKYWDNQTRKCIEGWWPNDDGTYVFMMPKLHFYINVYIVTSTNEYNIRLPMPPDFTDKEMIFMTYILCCYGFSGFSGDEYHTCHYIAKKLNNGEPLARYEEEYLASDRGAHDLIYDSHSKLKKYIEPWHYLTRHYLVEEPQGKPLGVALYGNPLKDGFIFGARATGKTYVVSSVATHEFLFGGIKRWEDVDKVLKARIIVNIGAPTDGKLEKFIECMHLFYDDMPGRVVFSQDDIIQSPMYRQVKGSWSRGSLVHEYEVGRETFGSKSLIQQGVYTIQNPSLFVSDRSSLNIREECGLMKNLKAVRDAEKMTMYDKHNDVKIGLALDLGTSGFIDAVQDCKDIFYHPDVNGIFGIPNYFSNSGESMGLFLGNYYARVKYKDPQGNTLINEAMKASQEEVDKLIKNGASAESISNHKMNNPDNPTEMFVDGRSSLLPSQEARIRLIELEEEGLVFPRGRVERIGGVAKFIEDPTVPIIEAYTAQTTKENKRAGCIVYELPIPGAPYGTYKVVYDPVKADGEGLTDDASLNAIYVYKGYYGSGLQDTLVFAWYFRDMNKSDSHEKAVLVTELYGATCLHEEDVGDFVSYCRVNNKIHVLASTPQSGNKIIIRGNAVNQVGVVIGSDPELKHECLRLQGERLLTPISVSIDGKVFRKIDNIYDKRYLNEVASFVKGGNFDGISAMNILSLWLRSETVVERSEEKTKDAEKEYQELVDYAVRRLGRRAS